jgi:hypothetical protein
MTPAMSSFLNELEQRGFSRAEVLADVGDVDEVEEAAQKALTAMPGIGFASVAQRMNCFVSVCRHLDRMTENGEIQPSQAQFVLNFVRYIDRRFAKAAAMFDLRAPRLGASGRAELPTTARQYLADLEYMGR